MVRQHAGQPVDGLIHHSDRGVQYVAIRYTQRLAEAGAVASVGSRGDSYDNALAEAYNSLFKADLVRNKGPWKGIDDLEIAVAEYVDWFNHRRLHGEIGLITRRVRRQALPSQPRPDTRRSVTSEPPLNPARDRSHARTADGANRYSGQTRPAKPPPSSLSILLGGVIASNSWAVEGIQKITRWPPLRPCLTPRGASAHHLGGRHSGTFRRSDGGSAARGFGRPI